MDTSQVTRKYSHASQFTKNLSFMTLEGHNLLQIKNGAIPFCMDSANNDQQKIYVHCTNLPKQNIMKYLILPSYQTQIKSLPQNKKTMKHSQEHSEFILLKITPFPHQKHQNQMPNSIYTLMMTVGLTFLLLLYFP